MTLYVPIRLKTKKHTLDQRKKKERETFENDNNKDYQILKFSFTEPNPET